MKHISWILLLTMAGCARLTLPDVMHVDESDWTSFGKNQQRVNATNEVVQPPLTLAWVHDITSGMGYGSPIVIDSFVIVTNLRGELHAINANTGKRIGWVNIGEAIHGSPVIDSHVAYMTSANARESVVAFDLLEGTILWKQEYGDIETTPLFYNGRLYFGNTAGIFFCIEKEKGEVEWKYRLKENTARKGIHTSATVSDDLVIFGADDGYMYALDAKHGTERWSFNTKAPVFASPAVLKGVVYCGSADGNFYALNANEGTLVWQFAAGASIYATASFTTNSVLIGTTGGRLLALNQNDGTKTWSTEFNSVINASAVVSGNVAYVGTLKKEFAAVRIKDGAIVWRDTLQGRIKTSPAIAHGRVFVATDDKLIHAFKEVEKKEQ